MPDGQNLPSPRPQLLFNQPGVRRDGTKLQGENYLSAEWCRWYQDRPRKMLGRRELRRDLSGIVRGIDVQSYNGYSYVHCGQQGTLQRFLVNQRSGLTTGIIDRTPSGFQIDPDNNWQFGLIYDTATDANLLIAHAAPNIGNIDDDRTRPVYFSEARDPQPMLAISGSDVSGGICPMWPYLMRFGNDGEIAWNAPGDISNLTGTGSGSARPWGTKVLRGLPLRGQQGPATLFWHLDALTRGQFVGGTQLFNFDVITSSTALLSSQSVIEHAGLYYWATVSGWQMFNGTVRDIPNEFNAQFWLENLSWDYRQKVFVMKIPRWKEIWWCGPLFGATEPNWAVIYNFEKGFWYDTPLPNICGGWSAGMYEQIFHYPIIASPGINSETNGTSVWQQEFGLDEVSGSPASVKAIRSYFQTNEFNTAVPTQPGQLGNSQSMSLSLVEPDFNQKGDLQLYLITRANARANRRTAGPIVIPEIPKGNEQTTKLKNTGRLTSFLIMSNTAGGYYEGGDTTFHWQPGDARTEDGGSNATDVTPDPLVFDDEVPNPTVQHTEPVARVRLRPKIEVSG